MSHPRWSWEKQWAAQNGLCWICLDLMDRTPPNAPNSATEDHLVPVLRGGANRWRNKLLAHQACNAARGAPFIWIPLNLFRRAAMKRICGRLKATTVDGVDLSCSHPFGSARTMHVPTRRLATVPSEMASRALRVPLAELLSLRASPNSCEKP